MALTSENTLGHSIRLFIISGGVFSVGHLGGHTHLSALSTGDVSGDGRSLPLCPRCRRTRGLGPPVGEGRRRGRDGGTVKQ